MQNLHLLEFLAEASQCHVCHFQYSENLTSLQPVPPGLPIIENGAHGTEKLLLKTEVSEDFA